MNPTITEKERQILNLLKTGMDQKDIAREVLLSTRAVKYTISVLCDRFGIISQKSIELVAFAIENNLVEKNAQKAEVNG